MRTARVKATLLRRAHFLAARIDEKSQDYDRAELKALRHVFERLFPDAVPLLPEDPPPLRPKPRECAPAAAPPQDVPRE